MASTTTPGMHPSTTYESKPPEWLAKASRDGDLGYHGFYPPRPGQEEEILSEANIKYGYTEPLLFGTELWPGTDTFISAFKQGPKSGLDSLQELMEKVITRRSELYAVVEDAPFKLPSRTSLNHDKKPEWYAKIGNLETPLHEISSIQHQQKNADSIELMHANKIPVERAFWYIRALGAVEVQAKYKSGNGIHPGMIPEWTTAITSFLKRQLGDIAIPATNRIGSNIKQVFKKAKLSEAESREAWVDKFAYSLELLRRLSDSSLIDQPLFLTWLASMVGPGEGMGPHQFIFLLRIIDEYFDTVASSRYFATPIIEACLARFVEIDSSPVRQHATCILEEMSALVLRFFRVNEDLFMNRNIVINHSMHMQEMLLQAIQQLDPDLQLKVGEDTMKRYEELMERLSSISSIDLPNDEDSLQVRSRLEDIATLNTIDISTDLAFFSFLPTPATITSTNSDPRPFSNRLSILLTWAVTPGQAGDPGVRPYVATTLISIWKSHALRILPNANQFLQRHLLSWLEEKDFLRPYAHQSPAVPPLKALFWRRGSKAVGELEAVAVLFGDLVHRRLFSFSDYLTRMTSFGQGSVGSPAKTELSMDSNESPGARPVPHPDHLELLRHLPLWDKISEQLLNQRKIVLYGIRARKTTEDAMEKEIRAEIRKVVPLFFNGPPASETFSRDLLPQTLVASKFVQARVIHHWLFDLVKDYISRTSASAALEQRPILPLHIYNVLNQIFAWTGCHLALFELNCQMLYHALDDDVLQATLGSISRYLNTWISMMRVERVVEVLLETNTRLKELKRKSLKPILALLLDIDECCLLASHLKESLKIELNEARNKILLSDAYSSSPTPPILPFILSAVQENSLEKPTDVATTIWYKNHAHADWGIVSWQAVVGAISSRSWDGTTSDQTMVERFTSLVCCLDLHLPDGIRDVVRIWFETAGAEEMMLVTDNEWHMMEQMTLSLASDGILSPQIVLDGLVFPVWNRAFQLQEGVNSPRALLRTIPLASAILLCHPPAYEELDNGFVLRLETCRARFIRPSSIFAIMRGTHALAIVEQDPSFDPTLREKIRDIRQRLLRDTFLRNSVLSRTLLLETVFESMANEYPNRRAAMIFNLKECLRDESDSPRVDGNISAGQWEKLLETVDLWSFPSARLDIRLLLEQLRQRALEDEQERVASQAPKDAYLESLAAVLSEGDLSTPGIALMAELVRGAETSLPDRIVRHGLEQLSLCFDSSDSNDPLAFVAPAKELLRLVITFRRIEVPSNSLGWAPALQDEFLQSWTNRVSMLQQHAKSSTTGVRGHDLEDVADAICFMMRVLHLFSELFGPDLGAKIVAPISNIVQLSMLFGGGVTLDEVTFSMLIDTACILMDDCSRETKAQLLATLNQITMNPLPLHFPAPSRYRLDSILPFNPEDKTISTLAQAHRINGEISYTSTVRNQSWEWMDSLDPPEPSRVLSTKVRNTAAMRLELFETTSKGESILSDKYVGETTKQGGDLWMLRDGLASEGLLARAWRESRTAAGDGKSVDENMNSERVGSSRGLSPAASRSSTHMSTSRRGSPSLTFSGRHGHTSLPTTGETMEAEPAVEVKPAKTLKRKARIEEDDADIIMIEDRRTASKTTQMKRGKGKGKAKR